VIGGQVPVPGWIGAPRSNRELAALTIKSWRFDRPRGIKVVPGVIDADAAWTDEDLADLAAVGASTVMVPLAASGDRSSALADAARSAGLRVGVTTGGRSGGVADSSIDRIAGLRPDVVVVRGADRVSAQDLLERTNASIGVTLAAGLELARDVVCAAADRNELGRVFVGSGLPGGAGVVPAAVPLFLDALAATTGHSREQLWSVASGNAARAFAIEGGTLEAGQPADLCLVELGREPATAWADPVRMTFIDGTVAWRKEAD